MGAARRTGATLVAYWLGSTKSYAWIVTADRVAIVELAPADRISRLSIDYRRVVETSLADPLLLSASPGDTLATTILTPLMALLPKTGRIIIVPDGALHQVNFEMLPVGNPRHYWIQDVTLAVAPSLTMLASRDARRAPAPTAVLLVGDPASTDPQRPPLRFARQEIDSIADTFATREVTTIRGRDASPAAYVASQPERYGIIHFAAHGTVNAQSPLDSAIELSPDTAGYKVYVRDVADRPIGATLVTISACRSANARTYAGEGLVGFAWAFLRAGARQVVAGLWNVDDQSTAELMAAFYRELASGASPAVALRTAKLAMLHRGGNFAKPYYWAPFELFVALDDSLEGR
jgi:CHAT domain-containing protein